MKLMLDALNKKNKKESTSMRFKTQSVLLGLLLVAVIATAGDKPIGVGMIPDAGATQVSIQDKAPLKHYLAKQMGRDVNLVIPTNYNATVEALGNGSLDFAYLGGVTYVKAHRQYGGIPLWQPNEERQFHRLFITGSGSAVKSLADLKGKTFAFGDIHSTSGHRLPYM